MGMHTHIEARMSTMMHSNAQASPPPPPPPSLVQETHTITLTMSPPRHTYSCKHTTHDRAHPVHELWWGGCGRLSVAGQANAGARRKQSQPKTMYAALNNIFFGHELAAMIARLRDGWID